MPDTSLAKGALNVSDGNEMQVEIRNHSRLEITSHCFSPVSNQPILLRASLLAPKSVQEPCNPIFQSVQDFTFFFDSM